MTPNSPDSNSTTISARKISKTRKLRPVKRRRTHRRKRISKSVTRMAKRAHSHSSRQALGRKRTRKQLKSHHITSHQLLQRTYGSSSQVRTRIEDMEFK